MVSCGISVDDPASEEDESSHSVHEDPKSSPPKYGISVDDPPSEVEESSHSILKDLKGAPPESCTFGVHTSDEDSTSASIYGCKIRCTTGLCPCRYLQKVLPPQTNMSEQTSRSF